MKRIITLVRDYFRGYTDNDLISLKRKFENYKPRPGGYIKINHGEYKAWIR